MSTTGPAEAPAAKTFHTSGMASRLAFFEAQPPPAALDALLAKRGEQFNVADVADTKIMELLDMAVLDSEIVYSKPHQAHVRTLLTLAAGRVPENIAAELRVKRADSALQASDGVARAKRQELALHPS